MDPQESMDQALIKWLAAHGPDEWHQVAISWNWDGGYNILSWIADQSACDLATAQFLVIFSDPIFFLRYPNRAALQAVYPPGLEGYDFTARMIERWDTGFYTRSEIASEEPRSIKDVERGYRAALAALPGDKLPWRMNDDLFQIIEGRQVAADGFTEGYPLEVWNAYAGKYD